MGWTGVALTLGLVFAVVAVLAILTWNRWLDIEQQRATRGR